MFLNLLERIVAFYYAVKPQRTPNPQALENLKLIAHRGFKSVGACENTIAAFDQALKKGCWGIEFDLRWTKDNIPIVNHDPDCLRVFGVKDFSIERVTYQDLKQKAPDVPTFSEVIETFAPRLHLMIEIKTILSLEQNKILSHLLKDLVAGKDYHFLGLSSELLDSATLIEDKFKVAVAETNTKIMSQLAMKRGYAGLAGHFLFVTDQIKNLHKSQGQHIGVGFINSKNSLYREVNRGGCDWFFADQPPL